MKRTLLLLASFALALAQAVPAQATLVADTADKPTMMTCLGLLFSNSEEHAAKCGGPFKMNENAEPLVKGSTAPTCNVGSADLPLYGGALEVWRIDMAGTCCSSITPRDPREQMQGQWLLPVGDRVLVAC